MGLRNAWLEQKPDHISHPGLRVPVLCIAMVLGIAPGGNGAWAAGPSDTDDQIASVALQRPSTRTSETLFERLSGEICKGCQAFEIFLLYTSGRFDFDTDNPRVIALQNDIDFLLSRVPEVIETNLLLCPRGVLATLRIDQAFE